MVVKCTAAVFFRTADWVRGGGGGGGQGPSPGSPTVIHVDERAIQYIVSIAKDLW